MPCGPGAEAPPAPRSGFITCAAAVHAAPPTHLPPPTTHALARRFVSKKGHTRVPSSLARWERGFPNPFLHKPRPHRSHHPVCSSPVCTAPTQARGYVSKEGRSLVPSSLGLVLTAFLQRYFAQYVDYGFTSGMEEKLDAISGGCSVCECGRQTCQPSHTWAWASPAAWWRSWTPSRAGAGCEGGAAEGGEAGCDEV